MTALIESDGPTAANRLDHAGCACLPCEQEGAASRQRRRSHMKVGRSDSGRGRFQPASALEEFGEAPLSADVIRDREGTRSASVPMVMAAGSTTAASIAPVCS
jgi:hypothetical protein